MAEATASGVTLYTVVASYSDPPSIYCETVEANSPDNALDVAWATCAESNWGEDWMNVSRDEEWSDTMVIEGPVKVIA